MRLRDNSMRSVQRLVNRDELIKYIRQERQISRIVVDLEEHAVHTRSHGGSRQEWKNSGWPPLCCAPSCPFAAPADGSCTECVASNTTGANSRITANDLMSTTRLLYPNDAPRSVKKTLWPPASRTLSTAWRMSQGDAN